MHEPDASLDYSETARPKGDLQLGRQDYRCRQSTHLEIRTAADPAAARVPAPFKAVNQVDWEFENRRTAAW